MEKYYKITELSWERIFLNFTIETNDKEDVRFAFKQKKRRNFVELNNRITSRIEEGDVVKYTFCVNMSAAEGRSFLPNAIWLVCILQPEEDYYDEEEKVKCELEPKLAYQFDDLSRVFRYGRKYALTVTFDVASDVEDRVLFSMRTLFMIENRFWEKTRKVLDANQKKGKLKGIKHNIVVSLMNAYYKLARIFAKKDGKQVLLMSENRTMLWGNLKAIDDRIKSDSKYADYKVDYSFRQSVGEGSSIFSWVKTVSKLAKADYIFVDDYVPIFGHINKSKKTKLIQVWHAGEGFKAVGYCRFGKAGSPYPNEGCHKKYDYALTGAEALIKTYEEVFGIEREAFLPVGMLRLDGFLEEGRINEFKTRFYKEYPQLEKKEIILFAPTYRGAGQKTAFYNYDWLDLKKLYEACGERYVFLIKMHPFVQEKIEIPEEYSDRIIEFSSYPDINELYYITQILITDYSSNFYEYSLMKRPIIFYTPDRELYEVQRGVHKPVKESAPGRVCDTFDEMLDAIVNDNCEIEKTLKFAEENFADYDGNATEKALDIILLKENV